MLRIISRLALGALLVGSMATAAAAQADLTCAAAFDPAEAAPGDQVTFFSSVGNEGDEPTVADLSVAITFAPDMGDPIVIGPVEFPFPLAAGEERSTELAFVIPPVPVSGSLTIDIAASEPGGSSCESSATLVIAAPREPAGSVADLLTTVADEVDARFGEPSPEADVTWAEIKSRY
jgi:hypothetical protein